VLAALGGTLAFLGFAGFDLWPLALVAFLPGYSAVDLVRPRGTRAVLGVSLLFGFVTGWGGFYWLLHVLGVFSGFPPWLCALFASVLVVYVARSRSGSTPARGIAASGRCPRPSRPRSPASCSTRCSSLSTTGRASMRCRSCSRWPISAGRCCSPRSPSP
jgi:hypothetical protein